MLIRQHFCRLCYESRDLLFVAHCSSALSGGVALLFPSLVPFWCGCVEIRGWLLLIPSLFFVCLVCLVWFGSASKSYGVFCPESVAKAGPVRACVCVRFFFLVYFGFVFLRAHVGETRRNELLIFCVGTLIFTKRQTQSHEKHKTSGGKRRFSSPPPPPRLPLFSADWQPLSLSSPCRDHLFPPTSVLCRRHELLRGRNARTGIKCTPS